MIGFFEYINNYEIFKQVITKIINYFKEKGIKKILAPMNFNTFHRYGFTTYGFQNYFLLDIQNKEYYPKFFQNFDFKILKNYYSNISYDLSQNLDHKKNKYEQAINQGFEFRKFNKKNL
ncbi:MAG: hypothetical protein ACP5RD_08220 [bacterium]